MRPSLTWRQAIAAFSRDARLYLSSAALMGFTIFGGIYSLLVNLYLLRLGYGPGAIGIVNAAGLLGWALACLPAGRLGRRWGSRRSMVVGMAVSMAGHLLLPLCEIAPAGPWRLAWLVSATLVGNVAISLFDVNSQPFLAAASTAAERNHLFSVQAALWPLAGFLGSLAGGVIPSLCAAMLGTTSADPASYRYPLIGAALLMGFAVWALARTRGHRTPDEGPGAASPDAGVQDAAPAGALPGASAAGSTAHLLPRSAIPLLGLAMFLQGSAEGAVRTFFNVYLDDALGAPTGVIGVLAAIGQLASAPAALLMPAVAKRWGHRRVFGWGTLGIGIGMLPLALVPGWTAAGAGYLVAISLVSLTRPAVGVYLMETMPEALRTTMSGVYTMAMGLSWSAAAFGGSRAITTLGYPAFFLAAAALTASSAAVFAAATRRTRR